MLFGTPFVTFHSLQHCGPWTVWLMLSNVSEVPIDATIATQCICNSICYVSGVNKMTYSKHNHYCDVSMGAVASQITSLTIVYSTVYSDTDQRKHQSSTSVAFVQGIHRGPVNSPHKRPVTRKMFTFDDVIMQRHKAQTMWIIMNYLGAITAITTVTAVLPNNMQLI